MRLINLLLVISLLSLPFGGLAHPPLYKLPKGSRITTPSGIVQSYTLEEMKVILQMDVDLENAEINLIPEYKNLVESYKTKTISQETIIKSKDIQIDLLRKDRDRISEKWSQENLAKHQCENKPQFGNWISWGIAGVAGTAAIVLGAVLAYENR